MTNQPTNLKTTLESQVAQLAIELYNLDRRRDEILKQMERLGGGINALSETEKAEHSNPDKE